MKLIVGGTFQGKKDYAKETFQLAEAEIADGRNCGLEEIFEKKAVSHFHLYLKRCMEEEREVSGLAQELMEKNPEVIVISNELGYGIVPVDKFDREYREMTGRVCCKLAKEAEEVHRVVCGVGTVIKHG